MEEVKTSVSGPGDEGGGALEEEVDEAILLRVAVHQFKHLGLQYTNINLGFTQIIYLRDIRLNIFRSIP